jgi:hypothetical protein
LTGRATPVTTISSARSCHHHATADVDTTEVIAPAIAQAKPNRYIDLEIFI